MTLRTIAEKLGVSHATVCLGLRDNPRISKTRRIQIKETALKLGYRPDPMLTALSHYRRSSSTHPVTSSLAWLSFWSNPEEMHAFAEFHEYWLGALEITESYGYRIEVYSPGSDYPISRVQSVLRTRNVSGIFIPPLPPASNILPLLESFDWSMFPVVRFGYSTPCVPAHIVTSAHVSSAIVACDKIHERGYRRIGFITRQGSLKNTRFPAGYLCGQLNFPAAQRLPILFLTDNESEDGPLLAAWIRMNRPDAILSNISNVQKMLNLIGLQVPADMGLATFSIHDGHVNAGINQNPREIGRAAAETLISLITHHTRGIPAFQREVLIDGSWVDGASLPDRTVVQPAAGDHTPAVAAVG